MLSGADGDGVKKDGWLWNFLSHQQRYSWKNGNVVRRCKESKMPDAALYGGDSGSSTDLSTSGSYVAQDQTEIDQLGKMSSAGGTDD
jgi:hypothetical protein